MIAHWLIELLDRCLPDLVGGERDRLALEIAEAFPRALAARIIANSARDVLNASKRTDPGALALEIGNNATQCLAALFGGESARDDDDTKPTALPAAIHGDPR